MLGPELGAIDGNPLGSNDSAKLGSLLGTSEGTEEGTSNYLLDESR